MAINYFDQLGFGNLGQRTMQAAQGTQGLRANEQAMQMNQQNMQRQQAADQQAALQFRNEQQKQQAAQGAGAFYNAINSGDDQAALQIAQRYADDINNLGDPTFTVDKVAQMIQTPEGKDQLKRMSLGMVQLAAGPEALARFASPDRAPEATAQIKNTAQYRQYTDNIRRLLQEGKVEEAKALSAERDFFVNQTDPFARSYASGVGAGQAKVGTEQQLSPVLAERAGMQEAAKLQEQQAVKTQQKQRKDATAFEAYQQAAQNVQELAGEAGSGAFGLAPAIFSNDRLFEGAISILRPTIKDVVREAGEGTFTEGDQKVLDQMMPTRVDSPEVRRTKLEMLDGYIRAKLGQPQRQGPLSPGEFLGGEQSPAPEQPAQQAPAQNTVGGYRIIEVR